MSDLQKILLVPDAHRPYHDRRAWKLMLKVAEDFKPDHVIVLGDLVDCFSVSSYSKQSRAGGLEAEIADANVALDELDDLKAKGKKVFLAGNHEWRLERYLMEKAPELLAFNKIEEFLRLQQRGWKYVPYKSHFRLGKIFYTHDTGVAGRYAVYRNFEAFQHSVIAAHTHRMGSAVEGSAVGERRISTTLGWLGDIKQVDYAYKVRANKDWTLGFGVAWMEPSGVTHVHPVPLINYRCVVAGKLYRG